jgi:hypothetical protein
LLGASSTAAVERQALTSVLPTGSGRVPERRAGHLTSTLTEFHLPRAQDAPTGISEGPDGNVRFTKAGVNRWRAAA